MSDKVLPFPARSASEPEVLQLMRIARNLTRQAYLPTEARQYAFTEACAFFGHLPKYEKPLEAKPEWERGCVCGMRSHV